MINIKCALFFIVFFFAADGRNSRRQVIREIVESEMVKNELASYEKYPKAMPIEKIQPTFYLFTSNRTGATQCYKGVYNFMPEKLKSGIFQSDFRHGNLFVLVHGYLGYICGEDVVKWASPLIDSIFTEKLSAKILFVDWEVGASDLTSSMPYAQTVSNSKVIGAAIANFLSTGQGAHCIGVEVGAHVCGFAGQEFELKQPGSKWSRITAISPAKSGYLYRKHNDRLSPDDADILQII